MKFVLFIITLFFFVSCPAQSVAENLSRGNEYYKESQYDLAERLYRQALKESPNNVMAQFNLANALFRQKRYDEAEAILKKLSTNNGVTKEVKSISFYNVGVLYSKQDELEESIKAYKNSLRLNPNDQQARENLQKALLELKQKQEQEKKNQQNNQKSRMSQQEAERRLQQLEEKEKQLQQRIQNQKSGNPMPQDW